MNLNKQERHKLERQARKGVEIIIGSIGVLGDISGAKTLQEALNTISENDKMMDEVEAKFRVSFPTIRHLFDSGAVDIGWVNFIYQHQRRTAGA
jgi:hypothetical protein